MKLSQLFTTTLKENPKDEISINAQLLERGGFAYKNSAGVYTYLPLGWRVMNKIMTIIREEMNAVAGQEILMPALVEKKYWDATDRWDVEIGFEVKGKKDTEANFILGWSHEDILTAIIARYINSYKDLPISIYQIQTKFRNEARAKSGLLRGREFIMKDMYSFHTSDHDLDEYYEKVATAYHNVFRRCGLEAIYTLAAGGVFTSNNTHEFQVVSDVGEDTIYVCNACRYAENDEISNHKAGSRCSQCKNGTMEEHKSIEVGNIFRYGEKYSKAVGLQYTDKNGDKKYVVSGAYGIGVGRLMATVVEVHHDDKGIRWPETIAPFAVHLICLDEEARASADRVYGELFDKKIEVLYDDRSEKTAGEKFADADLIGIPARVVVSKRTLETDSVEIKKRDQVEAKLILLTSVIENVNL